METCVIKMIIQDLYFGFCKNFQLNKFVVGDAPEIDQSKIDNRSFEQGGDLLLEVAVGS